ncbi:MAG: sulfotransferase [Sphingomicrobium sp.]
MASTTSIDDLTAGAIRRALASAAAGRLAEACAVGEQALAQGGDIAALNAMLGMLQSRAGDPERAVQHLRAAHAARPRDPIIANNLVNALVQLERQSEALDVLTDEVIAADKGGQLLKLRAYLAQITDQFDLAIRCYEQVVAKEPDDCESWNNLGNARRSGGDHDGSIEALRRAAELDRNSAPIRLNLASAIIRSGDWEAAEAELRQMAADFPDDPNPLRELHAILKEQGEDTEALEAIQGAVERAPDDLVLLLGLASHLSYMINSSGAEAIYRRVLELDHDNALAHLGLGVCFDLTNRTEELSVLVKQADKLKVGPNAQNFLSALDHRRAKRFAEGLAALELVPDDLESSRRAHLMGQLLEGVGRYEEAFQSYALMNELMSKEGKPPEERAAAYRDMLRGRHEAMTEEWVSRWRPETHKDPRASPVFLVGFPRSGTTLLDTMMMGHPLIEVLEEEPTLHKAFEIFQNYDDMPVATDEQIQAARNAYFETAATLTPLKPGSLLVDKNPLAMNAVPFIRRMFPDARIILAVRHPCDVVLSCYVTNFRLNAGMANFVRLDTAADLYDISFGYLERVQALMPTPTHVFMYERMVENRDSELRALFDFLKLDWHDAVLDHQSTALGRGRIKTASYAQVVEPIYKRSAGRWEHYRKHLEPILPVLAPWAKKFGYTI